MDDGRGREMLAAPLLSAKLAPPAPPLNHIDRPRLRHLLDEGARGALTVLTAPAGWGKTVALRSWRPPPDVTAGAAWFSVEHGDDGHRFWAYLHAGLSDGLSGPGALDGVPLPGSLPIALYLEILADALSRLPAPAVVILDNLQATTRETLAGLDFLLAHAPQRLRVVGATRVEPTRFLRRWRLADQLTEVRMADLAFTEAETAELLRRHGVPLAQEEVAELWRRTEGWPAGLRLAAGGARTADPIATAGGSLPDQAIADYLLGEGLLGLPTDVQEVLLRVCVPDRLSGELVDALVGRADGTPVAELDRHAFLFRTGMPATPYRLHRTFRDLLRAELARRHPRLVPVLHRRAATWFAANALPAEALRHALCAPDPGYAADLLVEHWSELVTPHPDVGSTVQVPEPSHETLAAQPEVALAYAAQCLVGQADAADDYLRLAARHDGSLREDRRRRVDLIRAAMRLVRTQHDGDRDRVLGAAANLLERARSPDRACADPARSIALTAIGSARLDEDDLDAAEAAWCEGLAAADRSGLSCQRLTCMSGLALVHADRGRLVDAARAARAACDAGPCTGGARSAAHLAPAYLALALVDLHRDRLAEAEAHLAAARAAGASQPAMAVLVAATLARTRQGRGDLDAAHAALMEARQALDGRPVPPGLARRLTVAEAGLRTAHGEPGDVRRWLGPLVRPGDPRSAAISVAAARACLLDGDPRTAAEILPPWNHGPDAPPSLTLRLEAGLIAAQAARHQGNRPRASQALEQVLRMAEPDGHRRIFLDAGPDVRDLLAEHLDSGTAHWALVDSLIATMEPQPTGGDPRQLVPCEPLTDRELTVLRYLQSILSNGEIAAEMTVSVNTVKTHLRSIYRKLQTSRRRDTVRRARELRLI